MPKTIPQNSILKSANYGHVNGDITESFGIDINNRFGAVTSTRMSLAESSADIAAMTTPIAIEYFDDSYWFISEDFIYSSSSPESGFTKDVSANAPTNINIEGGNMAIFNSFLYVVEGTDIIKRSTSSWSQPAGLQSAVSALATHLMTVFENKLYVTSTDKVYSISTSDVLSTTGTATIDFNLSPSFVPTFLEVAQSSIWVGYLDTDTSRGVIFQWDGKTENSWTRRIDLDTGVIAGTIFDNIPYIMDVRGRLLAYNGSGFTEVDRLFKLKQEAFAGVADQTEQTDRPVHPNGMITTERGTIAFLFKNGLAATSGGASSSYEDTLPSGVYEYSPTTGLVNLYGLSYSNISTGASTDYGQQRLNKVGALFFRRPNSSPFTNGAFLAGAEYFTNTEDTKFGLFTNDTFDTTEKYGYYITSKIFSSSIADTWQKVYTIFKNLNSNNDSIMVKYRTEEDIPTEISLSWSSTNRFLTNDDLSDYVEGDEVQVIQGIGSGKSAHIKSIDSIGSGYSVLLDDIFTGATGTAKALVSKWIKAGSITQNDDQFKGMTLSSKNTGPWIQLKVCMQFTGSNEVYKNLIINKSLINE